MFDEFRFRNIFAPRNRPNFQVGPFDPISAAAVAPTTVPPSSAPDTGLIALQRRSYPAMDEYRSYLKNAPSRENYKMGKVGNVLAAIAGGVEGTFKGPTAGVQTFSNLRDLPYERAMYDYERQGGRLRDLAELEYKTSADETKLQLDINKQIIDALQAESRIKLDNARVNELQNRARTQGKSFQKNEVTGQLEVVDIVTGNRQSIGQFAESLAQKGEREWKDFLKREGVQQAGRERLEGIRTANDERLTRLRKQLDIEDVTPQENETAFDSAYKQVITENANYRALFDTDDNGNLVLKQKPDEDLLASFMDDVKIRKNKILQRPVTPSRSFTKEGSAKVTEPAATDPLREAAVAYLRDNDYEEDEESIQEVMRQISEKANVASPPPINIPPVPLGAAPAVIPTSPILGQGTMQSPLFGPGMNQPVQQGIPQVMPPPVNPAEWLYNTPLFRFGRETRKVQ